MEIFGYAAILVMGVILGLIGGGGSILTVPILVYFFGLPPTAATGDSLFIVGLTALVGTAAYIRSRDVDFKIAVAFAVPSIFGVIVSRALILPLVPDLILSFGKFSLTKEIFIMAVFAALMVVASLSMIKEKKEKHFEPASADVRLIPITIEGFVVGVIAGFVGAGGGFLIIPALVFFAGLAMRVAIGTSLLIIAMQSLFGFAGDVSRGVEADWLLLTAMSSVAVIGIIFGSLIAHKIKQRNLKTAFGWFVLIIGTTIMMEQVRLLLL